jgi:hypothetical protein
MYASIACEYGQATFVRSRTTVKRVSVPFRVSLLYRFASDLAK